MIKKKPREDWMSLSLKPDLGLPVATAFSQIFRTRRAMISVRSSATGTVGRQKISGPKRPEKILTLEMKVKIKDVDMKS